MVSLPKFLQPFQEQARLYLEQKSVGDIEFSGGTYQVQVVDSQKQEEVWAFLQFDDKGRIKDRFCSCEGVEPVSACSHIAAAYLAIFGGKEVRLHERFQRSLWNQLGLLFAEKFGDDSRIIKNLGKGFFFLIEPKLEKRFLMPKGLPRKGKKNWRGFFLIGWRRQRRPL